MSPSRMPTCATFFTQSSIAALVLSSFSCTNELRSYAQQR
jgi:hypothetical protein